MHPATVWCSPASSAPSVLHSRASVIINYSKISKFGTLTLTGLFIHDKAPIYSPYFRTTLWAVELWQGCCNTPDVIFTKKYSNIYKNSAYGKGKGKRRERRESKDQNKNDFAWRSVYCYKVVLTPLQYCNRKDGMNPRDEAGALRRTDWVGHAALLRAPASQQYPYSRHLMLHHAHWQVMD